ncbi:DUF6890 family protein [Salinivibrio sp. SS3]|uniref:DUF6890 family protein n=1 Tax=Salinivibrio sp. SS3 TaxID=1895021 RepID=UPI003CD0E0CD
MEQQVAAIEHSDLAKLLTYRRKWLPHGEDNERDIARAMWLEKEYWQNMATATANGIAKGFTG